MPEYELMYWAITGLGEPIRLTLTIAGIPFKDTNDKNDENFTERKAALGCQVPVLLIDGEPFDQSSAIVRYLGAICKYDGKALYPTDPVEAFWCDNLIELANDAWKPLTPSFDIKDQAEREAARAALFAEDGKITKFLKKIDQRVVERLGQPVHIGDIWTFCILNWMRQPTFMDGIPAGNLDQYENLKKFFAQMNSLPPVLEYYKDAYEVHSAHKPIDGADNRLWLLK